MKLPSFVPLINIRQWDSVSGSYRHITRIGTDSDASNTPTGGGEEPHETYNHFRAAHRQAQHRAADGCAGYFDMRSARKFYQ